LQFVASFFYYSVTQYTKQSLSSALLNAVNGNFPLSGLLGVEDVGPC